MSIVQKLTFRSMNKNKSTSIVILIGIILSVALMTGLLFFSHSIYRFFRDDSIKKNGDSQIVVGDISRKRLEALPNQEMIEKKNLLSLIGVEKSNQDQTNHYKVIGITEEMIGTSIPLKILEGRLPSKKGEAVITANLSKALAERNIVGQNVVIDLHQPDYYERPANDSGTVYVEGQPPEFRFNYTKDEDLPVTIVGVVDQFYLGRVIRGNIYFVYQTPEEIEASNRLCVGFVLKDISTQRINTFVSGFGDLEYNRLKVTDYYPTVQSEMNVLMKSITYSLLTIVALAGIGLIQNGFLVSLSRRIRDLSVLSSIGMTRRQKWMMSLTEGLVMYLIGMPLGIVSGIGALKALFKVITPKMQSIQNTSVVMRFVWDPMTIVIIAISALVTLLIASIIPVLRSSQKTPLAGVRQQDEIKLKPRSLKSPAFISRLFGMEGEIAWKNQRRNKRRFRGTLIALVLSMVLFLTLSSLVHYLDLSSQRMTIGKDDLYVGGIQLEDGQKIASYEALLETKGVKNGFALYRIHDSFEYRSDHFSSGYEKFDTKADVIIVSYDTKTLDRILQENHITRDELKGKRAILVNQFFYIDDGRRLTQKILDHIPSTIEIQSTMGSNVSSLAIDVAKVVSDAPNTYESQGPSLQLIVLPETLEYLAKESYGISVVLNINANKGEIQPLINNLETKIRVDRLQGYVANRLADVQSTKDFIALASILIYGFLATILLIVIANIYNILSTSLRNRHREFAVLRSVGMDDREFRRMIRVESFFYSLKVVLYGLPLAVLTSFVVHQMIGTAVEFSFRIPYITFILSALAVVAVVILIMNLSSRKTRKGNILDALRMDAEV